MPRKRTPDEPSTKTETTGNTESATATLEPPAMPEQAQSPTEPQAVENAQQNPGFVERLQQQRGKNRAPDPFGIASDSVAGIRLFESKQDRVMAIKFEEKPGEAVLEFLKDAGYRWNPRDKVWVTPVRPETARSTRIDAERLYQEIRHMIRQERGIESGQEIPF